MIRDSIAAAQIAAMKAGDKPRLAAIRLIMSTVKNRDIELRTAKSLGSTAPADDDVLVSEVMARMIKQRRESIAMYETGGRAELAAIEAGEIAVIESFLPRQMDEAEAGAAIDAIVAETGAASLKDVGRVMALVKERYAGKMDMGQASALVKARLG